MVHRFIVRSEIISPASPQLVNHVSSGGRWTAMIAVAVFAGATLFSLQLPNVGSPAGDGFNTLAVLTMTGFGVAFVLYMGNNDQCSTLHECVVSIYPIGIQIECFVLSSQSGQADVQMSGHRKPIFFPRETVIDCVVSEVVHSQRVSSKLLFRIGEWPKFSRSEAYVHLVEAFPGVELTFVECLAMRAEMNRYLLQEIR
jgi:hypothetical protein